MGDGGGGHWLVRKEWRPAEWSVCLPLLISPCTIKSRSSLLAPAHPGGPGKRAVKRLWCGGVVWTIREGKSRNKRSNTKSVELNKNIFSQTRRERICTACTQCRHTTLLNCGSELLHEQEQTYRPINTVIYKYNNRITR